MEQDVLRYFLPGTGHTMAPLLPRASSDRVGRAVKGDLYTASDATEEEGWDSGGEVSRRRKRRMKRGGEVEEAKVAAR